MAVGKIKGKSGNEYYALYGPDAISYFNGYASAILAGGTTFGNVVEDILSKVFAVGLNPKFNAVKALNVPSIKNFPFADLAITNEVGGDAVLYSVKASWRESIDFDIKYKTVEQGLNLAVKAGGVRTNNLRIGAIATHAESALAGDDFNNNAFVFTVYKCTPSVDSVRFRRDTRSAGGFTVKSADQRKLDPKVGDGTWKFLLDPITVKQLSPKDKAVSNIESFRDKMLGGYGEITTIKVVLGPYTTLAEYTSDQAPNVKSIVTQVKDYSLLSTIGPNVTRPNEVKRAKELYVKLSGLPIHHFPDRKRDRPGWDAAWKKVSTWLSNHFQKEAQKFRREISKAFSGGRKPRQNVNRINQLHAEILQLMNMMANNHIAGVGYDPVAVNQITNGLIKRQQEIAKLGGYTKAQQRQMTFENTVYVTRSLLLEFAMSPTSIFVHDIIFAIGYTHTLMTKSLDHDPEGSLAVEFLKSLRTYYQEINNLSVAKEKPVAAPRSPMEPEEEKTNVLAFPSIDDMSAEDDETVMGGEKPSYSNLVSQDNRGLAIAAEVRVIEKLLEMFNK